MKLIKRKCRHCSRDMEVMHKGRHVCDRCRDEKARESGRRYAARKRKEAADEARG